MGTLKQCACLLATSTILMPTILPVYFSGLIYHNFEQAYPSGPKWTNYEAILFSIP